MSGLGGVGGFGGPGPEHAQAMLMVQHPLVEQVADARRRQRLRFRLTVVFVWLAIIAVLNSVAAAYYYLRLIVYMYMREPEPGGAHGVLTPAAGLALALAVWATLHFGLLPGAAFAFARRAIAPLLS